MNSDVGGNYFQNLSALIAEVGMCVYIFEKSVAGVAQNIVSCVKTCYGAGRRSERTQAAPR